MLYIMQTVAVLIVKEKINSVTLLYDNFYVVEKLVKSGQYRMFLNEMNLSILNFVH